MILPRRFSRLGYPGRSVTTEQGTTLYDIFPGHMKVLVFMLSDRNIIADCGDERPVCVGLNGEWEFVMTPN